jgi:hypothetical protein
MSELFSSGRAIDLAIALLVLELFVVSGWMRPRAGHLLPTMMAGLGLLVAWRVAQGGAAWIWIALPLSLGGLAHAWDLWRRWSWA